MSDDTQRLLGSIDAKVDILLSRTDGYEKRLGAVEKRVWYSSGVSSVLAFIAARVFGTH